MSHQTESEISEEASHEAKEFHGFIIKNVDDSKLHASAMGKRYLRSGCEVNPITLHYTKSARFVLMDIEVLVDTRILRWSKYECQFHDTRP